MELQTIKTWEHSICFVNYPRNKSGGRSISNGLISFSNMCQEGKGLVGGISMEGGQTLYPRIPEDQGASPDVNAMMLKQWGALYF